MMDLSATVGKKNYQFTVTPVIDKTEMLYFLIEIRDGGTIMAQRIKGKGEWLHTVDGAVTNVLSKAIFKKIERTSVCMLLDKVVRLDQLIKR